MLRVPVIVIMPLYAVFRLLQALSLKYRLDVYYTLAISIIKSVCTCEHSTVDANVRNAAVHYVYTQIVLHACLYTYS